ncbi:MAG: ATP-dependent DNA helicase RecG [Candidatus Peregrinibacteria bacterium GW2011_GWA2_44_7]|nr:MAG: ATP-dependent DNA helicase RecG [Candidatus Peregrinibacteria bacterium GW2011_GWA2_44_7]
MQAHPSLLQTKLSEALRTTRPHLEDLRYLGLHTIEDFFHYFPRSYRDQTDLSTVAELRTDQLNVVQGKLSGIFHRTTHSGKFMTLAHFSDSTASVEVMWFNQPHLKQLLRNGDEVILTGKAKWDGHKITLMSPRYEPLRVKQLHTARLVPVYHEHNRVTSKWIREKINPLLKGTALLEDYMPSWIVAGDGLMPYTLAVRTVHDPKNEEKLFAARQRLAFDELFLLQLNALQKRLEFRESSRNNQRKMELDPEWKPSFYQQLPFPLTQAQQRVMQEIWEDLRSPYPMMRLLQGDVGSGKTVVAAFGLFHSIKAGFQGVLMAPTEILAKQHFESFSKLLKPFGFNIQFLTGSLSGSQKEMVLRQIATGTVDLVIGTHALIQERVCFAKLGLVVVDEQHRFGVKQRERLQEQGSVPEQKRLDAERWIADQIQKGRQVFIVCPLIDESDVLGVKAVTKEYERLSSEVFSAFRVGLLHGKLKPAEKEAVMEAFNGGGIDILVATSVVEVGIDVPNATIMLIEGADRFGLSQLHQFRGRVGRGKHQSYCFLFTESTSDETIQRLKALVEHSSGFKLAEIDLLLRGPGEIYGVKQSGIPDLKMASLGDAELIHRVRQAAEILMAKDPYLKEHPSLRSKMEQDTNEKEK